MEQDALIVTDMRFGRDGNATKYQVFGWSLPENGFTWTDGLESALWVNGIDISQSLWLELRVSVYTPPGVNFQPLVVKVNGVIVGRVACRQGVPPGRFRDYRNATWAF